MVLRMWQEMVAGVMRHWRIVAVAIAGECEVWLEEHRGAWPIPEGHNEDWRAVTWGGYVARVDAPEEVRALVIIGRPALGWARGLQGKLRAAVEQLTAVPGEIERRVRAEPIIEREIKRYLLQTAGVRSQESGVRRRQRRRQTATGETALRMEA